MFRFEDALLIKGNMDEVYDAFYHIEEWPNFTPHVTAIEMLENDGNRQRLLMHVSSNGRKHLMETVRTCYKNEKITYHQTQPPVLFTSHHGEWRFEDTGDGIEVKIVHHVEINPDAIGAILGVESMDEAAQKVQEILTNNSMQTMRAIKTGIEKKPI